MDSFSLSRGGIENLLIAKTPAAPPHTLAFLPVSAKVASLSLLHISCTRRWAAQTRYWLTASWLALTIWY
jgi:hypothetical protein